MRRCNWDHREDPSAQAAKLADMASEIGFLVVDFKNGGNGSPLPWAAVEAWVRGRAVTVAVLEGVISSPAVDIALCSDLVYLLPSTRLCLAPAPEPPSPGVIWALGRAGRRALARGLLSTAEMPADEAVAIGIAHQVLVDRRELPLPADASLAAVTSARDLMRSASPGSGGLALELAAFRLLFAAGDPSEGAAAFLDKRDPSF